MNINTIIQQQGIIYDRSLNTTLTLPYSGFETIKLKQNESVTNFNINSIITKLYENYLQLYKYTHIASNVMPITSVAMLGVSAGVLSFYRSISTSQLDAFGAAGFPGIGSSNVLTVRYNPETDSYAIFTTNGNNTLLAFTADSSFTMVASALSARYTSNSINATPWQNITDLTFDGDNSLYVLDSDANSIYKYNASGFLTNDNILKNKLVYTSYIGGKGNYNDNTKFNKPNSIAYYDSEIYVLDAGNSCIKKYDTNLNWEITYRLFRDFLQSPPLQIGFSKMGVPFVLLANNQLIQYSNDFNTKQIYSVIPLSGDNSTIKKFTFSSSDSNVLYLYSNNYVYKCLISDPADFIGRYSLSRFRVNTTETINAVASVPVVFNNQPSDCNFILSTGGAGGKICLYYDNINTVSVLADEEFDVYPLDVIKINPDEYLQNWVINKAISKLLLNHMRLRDNIVEKLIYKKDIISGDVLLSGTRYFVPSEMDTMAFHQEITNYIGINEIFQNTTVNRPFEYIYNIQINLLNILQAEKQNYFDLYQIAYF